MANIVSDTGTGDFERPEPGLHQAVCTHVTDLGIQDTTFGPKAQIALTFELAEHMSDGTPFVKSKKYTRSLNSKSTLRKDLVSWRTRDFTEEELKGFDVDNLIGVNCLLNLVLNKKDDKEYINIGSILPVQKNAPKIMPSGQSVPEWITDLVKKGRVVASAYADESIPDSAPEDDLPF